jgi:hypothetical protein
MTEIGQLMPSRESNNPAVRALGVRACEALQIERGIAHVEILINDETMTIVEAAARPGGDGIMDLVDRVYGFNPYDMHIASYLDMIDMGMEVPQEPAGIAVCIFLKAPPGIIKELRPVNHFAAEELSIYVTSPVGSISYPASSYQTRNGVFEYFEAGAGADQCAAVEDRAVALAQTRTREIFGVDN